MPNFFVFISIFFCGFINAQELKCNLKVNTEKLGTASNQKIFKTLETSLNDFVNNTIWTTDTYKQNEKISCSMTLIIESLEADNFSASLQVQSSRVGFNSTYSTPVFNVNDKNFNFKYQEFEPLLFNPNAYDSNLISVMAFYCNLIIGLDQDTFDNVGGSKVLDKTLNIANNAQASGSKGWTQNDGPNSRYFLINDMLSTNFLSYREAMYNYHLKGIDLMEKSPKTAKENISNALNLLNKMHDVRPNSYLSRVFFDIKSDEIVAIFTGGPAVKTDDLLATLNRVSPLNAEKWSLIKR